MARANSRLIAMRGQMHLLDAMEHAGAAKHDGTNDLTAERIEWKGPVEIHVRNLTLAYQGGEAVVDGLNTVFESGQIHTITGASGSGKSTLISALLGLHKPQSGEISISGKTLGSEVSSQQWLGHVAYLAQQPFLFSGSVRDNLTLGTANAALDESRILELMRRLHLTEALGANPLDFKLNEGGSNLSGGQQQRLALIRALQLRRSVLILDEATSSLDPEMRDAVLDLLREEAQRGTTVLLVTHDSEIARGFSGVKLA